MKIVLDDVEVEIGNVPRAVLSRFLVRISNFCTPEQHAAADARSGSAELLLNDRVIFMGPSSQPSPSVTIGHPELALADGDCLKVRVAGGAWLFSAFVRIDVGTVSLPVDAEDPTLGQRPATVSAWYVLPIHGQSE